MGGLVCNELGGEWFDGEIVSFDAASGNFRIVYSNGTDEQLTREEVAMIIVEEEHEGEYAQAGDIEVTDKEISSLVADLLAT